VSSLSLERGARVERIVRQHQLALRRYLVFLGCPAALLDDLVQDVFLSVLAGGFQERGAAATRAFLRKVARHLYLKSVERERRGAARVELEATEAEWVRFEREDEGRGYLAALRECVAGLRGRPREALRLRYEERRRTAAIADALGLSEGGVKSILVRTRKRLRRCVEARLEP
jgi:RNA polymerase sigma-70 factor (ECF subfamily)